MTRPRSPSPARLVATLMPIAFAVQVAAATAGVPDPIFSAVTPVLVGTPGGDAIVLPPDIYATPGPGFHVVAHDVGNAPEVGRVVAIDFSSSPSIRMYTSQQPGVTVDCASRQMTGLSGAGGLITFFPRFGGFDNDPTHVLISAAGVILGGVPARSTDMDAQGGGVGLADLIRFTPLYLAGSTANPEADFDGSGGPIGLADLVIFAHSYLEETQGQYCP
jgi:hypothetical protein